MSSDCAIRVHRLSKCYRVYERPEDRLKEYLVPRIPGLRRWARQGWASEIQALRDVSFDVGRGETLGIIGRNGSGKSTLLELVCGTLSPTSGTIEVEGRIGALLELGAGFDQDFTGRENVYLGASLHGLSRAEVDARFDAIAGFADIGEFIDRPVRTYSTGMYVRLAFALVAHVDADILVIDEALAVGDAFFVQKCMRFLRAFMERGTLLFVSHDLGAIATLCDRAMLLGHGGVEMLGEPKAVIERYLAGLCEESPETPEGAPSSPVTVDGSDATASGWQSEVRILGFHPQSGSFGTGRARIVSVKLLDAGGRELVRASGGDPVNLRIIVAARNPIERPIVGFQLKDRLGQVLFGDNTFLSHRHRASRVEGGGELEANFTFRMPVLPTGDYTFSVAIAEGSQEAHVQHHWMHDAFLISAYADASHFGLVGVPMTRISLVVR